MKSQAPTIPAESRAPIAAALLLVLGAFLIFANLGNRYLWEDEAETALLARSILIHGIPKAFDGKNLISQELGRDYDSNYVWRWTPWLEKYVAALSFAALGEGTWSARVPFALAGIVSLLSLYLLTLRIFKDPWLAALSLAFLTFSIPFLLYTRQCRYYSLAILGSIWSLWFLFSLIERRRWAMPGFVVALSVVFHSNYLIFLGTTVALAVCLPLLGRRRDFLLRGALALVLPIIVNLPWILFFDVVGKSTEAVRLYSPWANLRSYYFGINQFAFPLLAMLLFLPLLALHRRRGKRVAVPGARPFLFLLAFAAVFVGFISLAPWSFFRYLVGLLPVFAILQAYVCRTIWAWNRVSGSVVTVVLLFTGLLHTVSTYPVKEPEYGKILTEERSKPFAVVFPLYNYLYEITHDFDGPIEGIVKLLRAQARPNDRVFISYGDLPLKFYTSLEVKGGSTGENLTEWAWPEWVIVREFFRFGNRREMREDAERMREWLARIPPAAYRQVDAGVVDTLWESIPEPAYHRFRTRTEGGQVTIWRRVDRR